MKNVIMQIKPARSLAYNVFLIIRPLLMLGTRYKCNICGWSFRRMLPRGEKNSNLEKLRVAGTGYRKNAVCPRCFSSDRDRMVYNFLMKEKLLGGSLLHVAPEKSLKKIFREKSSSYENIDIDPARADTKMDITQMVFKNDSFDSVICNHVLEHIDDDDKAIREIHRVLKPNAWAILQVPITFQTNTLHEHLKEDERVKKYGDSKHLRLYGKDFPDKLKKAGFDVSLISPSSKYVKRHALFNEQVIFCRKIK